MMRNFNLYDTLGVTAEATQKDIKKAYQRQALISHPDKTRGSSERMKLINQAYAILSDTDKRREFDQVRDCFQEEDDQASAQSAFHERLSTAGIPYSQEFRARHAHLVLKFSKTPLLRKRGYKHFHALAADAWQPEVWRPLFEGLLKKIPSASTQCVQALSEVITRMRQGKRDSSVMISAIKDLVAQKCQEAGADAVYLKTVLATSEFETIVKKYLR